VDTFSRSICFEELFLLPDFLEVFLPRQQIITPFCAVGALGLAKKQL
jgi:hypothetical protein